MALVAFPAYPLFEVLCWDHSHNSACTEAVLVDSLVAGGVCADCLPFVVVQAAKQ